MRRAWMVCGLALLAGCFNFEADRAQCLQLGYCEGDGGAVASDDGGDAGEDAGSSADAGDGGAPADAGPDDAGPGDAGPIDAGVVFSQPYYSCDPRGWCWDRPWPQGFDLTSVSGTVADVWAAGVSGVVVHLPLDGGVPQVWDRPAPGATSTLRAIWSDGTGAVVAGLDGTMFRLVGTGWEAIPNEQSAQYTGLFGADGLLFATGTTFTDPVLAVSDGGAEGFVRLGVDAGYLALTAITGSSASDLWAGGTGGHLVHVVNGVPLDAPPFGSTDVLTLHALSPTSIWAGTRDGKIVHSDGSTWGPPLLSVADELDSISGSSDSDIFATTPYAFYHCTLTGCVQQTAAWGYGAVHAVAPGRAVAVGINGGIAVYDGSWTELISPSAPAIYGLAATPSGGLVAVGADGSILLREQGRWRALPPVANRPSLTNVCFDARGRGWIPTSDSQLLRLDPDGGLRNVGWRLPGGALAGQALWSVACGPDETWAVGAQGGIGHGTDGGALIAVVAPSPAQADLNALWMSDAGYVVGVGNGGTVVVTDGGQTVVSALPGVASGLFDILGYGPDDLWISGGSGNLWHWNGAVWTQININGRVEDLTSIWGETPGEVWVVGANGLILHLTDNGATVDETYTYNGASLFRIIRYQGHLWTGAQSGAVQFLQ